ncbi:Uncharacterised protein [Mycobacteroides abscessus subsp. abscessus]|nr:Uncharacterised protein [Mycobacteroides abscessus subsp. abscessus]
MISTRQMRSCDVYLTDSTHRNRAQSLVKNVNLSVDLGSTDRYGPRALDPTDLVARGVDDGLRRAVKIVQRGIKGGVEFVGNRPRQCLSAYRHAA